MREPGCAHCNATRLATWRSVARCAVGVFGTGQENMAGCGGGGGCRNPVWPTMAAGPASCAWGSSRTELAIYGSYLRLPYAYMSQFSSQ
jgi:hypothetical protein